MHCQRACALGGFTVQFGALPSPYALLMLLKVTDFSFNQNQPPLPSLLLCWPSIHARWLGEAPGRGGDMTKTKLSGGCACLLGAVFARLVSHVCVITSHPGHIWYSGLL